MFSRKRRALVALQLREDGRWIPGKKPGAAYSSAGKKAAAGTKARMGKMARAGKAPVATKAGAGTAGAGTKTRAGKAAAATAAAAGTAAAGTPPALTPKVEVTEEEPAPGPLLPYPPGFGPKVEDGGASHSTPPPPAAGKGPSNASQVILAMKYTSFVRCKSSESVHILIYEKE